MADSLRLLLGSGDAIAKAKERYKLEGLTATFATIPKPTGDFLTGDHQPQAAVIKYLATRPYFNDNTDPAVGAKIRHRASGSHADNAYVVNLQGTRHGEGRTFKGKGGKTKNDFINAIVAMEAKPQSATKRKDKEVAQRKEAVGLLKLELSEDVKMMRTVYTRPPADAVWADLDAFTSGTKPEKDTQKKTLVTDIQGQVSKGLSVMAAQPMNELAE
jgi:hypothetical protein